MHPRSFLKGAVGFLFPLAVFGAILALLVRLVGEPIRPGFLVLALLVLMIAVVIAAATTAVAVVRRQWWWAASLLVLWPVTVPLYLWAQRRRAERDGDEGGSAFLEV